MEHGPKLIPGSGHFVVKLACFLHFWSFVHILQSVPSLHIPLGCLSVLIICANDSVLQIDKWIKWSFSEMIHIDDFYVNKLQ